MSDGVILQGQLLYGPRRLPVGFTEQMRDVEGAASQLGNSGTEITPNDRGSSEVKVYGNPDFGDNWIALFGYANIVGLPNVLTDLSVVYEQGGEVGDYDEQGSAIGTAPYSLGISLNGSAQASVFHVPKLLYKIHEPFVENMPVLNCFYYDDDPTLVSALVKTSAELGAAVSEWPQFHPVAETFVLFGLKVNSSAKIAAQGTNSVGGGPGSSASQTAGRGHSYDFSPSIESVRLPSCIHAAFDLDPSADVSKAAAGTVTASGLFSGTETVTAMAVATAHVTPESINATVPAALPASGLYLYRMSVEPVDEFGFYFVHAIIFDFSEL